ncbi:MAG TPA: ATP-dependent DNA ligase [Casimicrobiaceae bacterium]|nr:ATP-dependent DNA ligase [Casimicrobiaceae bacterium]
MEAKSVATLPEGDGWQYEPKWDGFRCLAFRDGETIALRSKSGQGLERYFPEIVAALAALPAKRFVLDGELVVPDGAALSFEALLMRIHPAASRVTKLAREQPAVYVVFDLLADERGRPLVEKSLAERRVALEAFAAARLAGAERFRLSPATTVLADAERWLAGLGTGLDGIIAKRLDRAYAPGERTAMQKWKRLRTADCVVGGFRYGSTTNLVGSLLLGLFDDEGLLHHVGFTSNIPAGERETLTRALEQLRGDPGFTGRAPGGPSRWSSERSAEWEPLATKLVVEVQYDHFSGGRFRHGTKFLRWRPDKAPKACTLAQVAQVANVAAPLAASA